MVLTQTCLLYSFVKWQNPRSTVREYDGMTRDSRRLHERGRPMHVHDKSSNWEWRRNEFESGGAHPHFGSKSWISRFVERFRDGQRSLVSFLFAVLPLTVPPRAQPFVNVRWVGGRAPVPNGIGVTGNWRVKLTYHKLGMSLPRSHWHFETLHYPAWHVIFAPY